MNKSLPTNKKICIFCETWETGGIESFLANVLCNMDLTGLDVSIVAERIKGSVFTSTLQLLGIQFVELTGKPHSFQNFSRFQSLLEQQHYDVVYLNLYQGLALRYAAIAKRAGVPRRIAHSHNSDLRRSSTRLFKLLMHHLAKFRYSKYATDFWACSADAAAFLFSSRALMQYRFIPNGIDTGRFRFQQSFRDEVRQSLGLSNSFVIGNVGRLCYQKNQEFLIDLLAGFLPACPNAVLMLVGDGPDESRLLAKAHEMGVSNQVLFLGTTQHIEKFYCAMDVFAFPSRFEGLGIAAVEAQCAGLPVLCAEGLPQEVKCSSSLQFLPLGQGIKPWLEALGHLSKSTQNRFINHTAVGKFDIHSVSALLSQEFRSSPRVL